MPAKKTQAPDVSLALRAGTLVTPDEQLDDQLVLVSKSKITEVRPFKKTDLKTYPDLLDAHAGIVTPGLVETQVNGAFGHGSRAEDAEHLDAILGFYLRRGVTSLLATVTTGAVDELEASMAHLAERCGRLNLTGIHLEGPFLNPERSGAHPPEHIKKPDAKVARRFVQAADGKMAIMTIAPEMPGSAEMIEALAQAKVIVSAGHCLATYADMMRACDAGLGFVTHLGNANDWPYRKMNEYNFLGSEPGVVGSFLVEPRLRGNVILDGFHFHPALLRALVWARGVENVCLTSDASPAAGCKPGVYKGGGLDATIHPEGYATSNLGGGWLAGSMATLGDVVKVAATRSGLPLVDVVRMATSTPADIIGQGKRRGRVAPGYRADLVLLSPELDVQQVVLGGKPVAMGAPDEVS